MTTLMALLALTGCNDDAPKDSGNQDTVVDTDDTSATTVACTSTVFATLPATGASDVYYRGILEVDFTEDGTSADIAVLDPTGAEVALSDIVWADGNLQVFFRADLAPSTTYTLSVGVCGVVTESIFATTSLGEPLTEGNAALTGKTYVMRLSDADIVEPAFLDPFAAQYLTVPLLFQITAADDSMIDFLGALGYQEDDGTFAQIEGQVTWDFPAGDFTDSPYFYAEAEYIVIIFDDIAIPIENFTLEGSFPADGSQIAKGRATGKADSRNMGPLVNQDDEPGAICDLAATLGVYCEPCSDGEPYCLFIIAEEIYANEEPGLTLVEVLPDTTTE